MIRLIIIAGICITLLFAVGCSNPTAAQDTTKAADTVEQVTDAIEPNPEPIQADSEALYSQIEMGMAYDEVIAIIAGHEPFMKTEGAIDTPTGQIITQNISWKIGNHIITAIFQDNKLIGKDLTKM